ncbi:hypothetical protein ACU4GD_14645 [Cupriavidus basilensis]
MQVCECRLPPSYVCREHHAPWPIGINVERDHEARALHAPGYALGGEAAARLANAWGLRTQCRHRAAGVGEELPGASASHDRGSSALDDLGSIARSPVRNDHRRPGAT